MQQHPSPPCLHHQPSIMWHRARRFEAKGVHVPRSRKYCAVPFIGKDVPSPASEFSHPDVVIGLTIMAFRYQVCSHAVRSSQNVGRPGEG